MTQHLKRMMLLRAGDKQIGSRLRVIIMTALRDDLENHLNGNLFRLPIDKQVLEQQSI